MNAATLSRRSRSSVDPTEEPRLRRLLAGAAAGNERDATALLSAMSSKIEATAARVVRRTLGWVDSDTLADCISRANEWVVMRAGEFDPEKTATAQHFIRRTAKSAAYKAINETRSREQPPSTEAGEFRYRNHPSNTPPPDAEIEHREYLAGIHAAIAELPRFDQILLDRLYVRDMTQEVVAAELGVSRSMLQQRIAQAREALRSRLAEHDDTDRVVRRQRLNEGQQELIVALARGLLISDPSTTLNRIAAEIERQFGVRRGLNYLGRTVVRPLRRELGINIGGGA